MVALAGQCRSFGELRYSSTSRSLELGLSTMILRTTRVSSLSLKAPNKLIYCSKHQHHGCQNELMHARNDLQ